MESERIKWERYYASAPEPADGETARRFQAEFVALVDELLPGGGRVLEAGCGAGGQSLALAASGRYRVTLLDFAGNALTQARRRFEQAGLQAEFLLEDAFTPGEPRYDLVFNAGVLEHYDPDEQAALLRGMASRSRRYVLALLPNRRNYWYWLWRVRHAAAGEWPFGKETPADDLSAAFRAAGLRFLGQRYLGDAWTEDFIAGLGLDPDLARLLTDIHRSGLLPPEQTGYLVAALGAVDDSPSPPRWVAARAAESTPQADTLTAALADSLALQVAARADAARLGDEIASRLDALTAQITALERAQAALAEQMQAHDVRLADLHQGAQTALAEMYSRLEALPAQFDALLTEVQTLLTDGVQRTAAFGEQLQRRQRRFERRIEARLGRAVAGYEDALRAAVQHVEQALHSQLEAARQIEHDYTTALLARDQEIETLRAQVEALKAPPRRGVGLRLRALGRRILLRVGLLAPLKRLRHLYRKEIAAPRGTSQASYRPPIALGHPAVPPSRRVFILTYTFFDFDGREAYAGGAERYLLELAVLLRARGYTPEVVQCGNGYWVRRYRDLRVTGLDVGGEAARLPQVFHRLPHEAALVIYSPFSLAAGAPAGQAALGISHGVFWDYADFRANRPAMDALRAALERLETVVSVDTNTINWARAEAAAHADKFVYLPNFVDTEAYTPGDAGRRDAEVVILYPRRLYRPRGYWLVAEVLPDILARYPRAVFHFVGQADPAEADHVRDLMARYPGRVRWETLPPEEMPRAYRNADITLIPTVHSEGTSLSCLEALASGNAVIATDVGGLPDLIVPDYNGLLIQPTAEALRAAIERLLDDPDLSAELGRRGRESAQAFSLTRWRARWESVLDAHLPPRPEGPADPLPAVFFPAAPGVSWEGIQQRPHHLARQLAYAGVEVFWGNPTRRLDSPHPLLHILGP
ncbi:MAG: glycosyltransferase, partial [Anaerolineae bacterium]